MRLPVTFALLLLLLLLPALLSPAPLSAESADDKLIELNKQIQEYQRKLTELAGQKRTVAAAVNYLNAQIGLAQSQIAKTERELVILNSEIDALQGRISQLNSSLDDLSNIVVNRIRETYRQANIRPLYLFLASDGFSDFISRYKYLKTIQNHDREILLAMERSRANYNLQKSLKEEKQTEVEAKNTTLKRQKSSLAIQQQEKQQLLELTKNDEKRFQELLSKARSELEAIQSIIAGRGQETRVGEVTEGNKIASVIPGISACSTGAHLHMEVVKDASHRNPFEYLSSKAVIWNNADPQPSFTGSWNWPINDPVRITQGYGRTSYSSIYANGFHTGVDMVNNNNDYDVKAVKNGILYRGSIACGGGVLRYVKVDHGDGLATYYLHVNYI